MDQISLIRTHPECAQDEGYTAAVIDFNPRDAASVRAAQRALQARYGLADLPALCSEPELRIRPRWDVLRRLAHFLNTPITLHRVHRAAS